MSRTDHRSTARVTKPQPAAGANLLGLPARCSTGAGCDVNGPAWKALIEEEFGERIMSAIDFDMTSERVPDPKGDRVKIGLSGKFLPFKYYGAAGVLV